MSWRISFLGKISATREGTTLSRFESSRAVALLARLALFPRRTHPREELIELLWPEIDPAVGRNRLRNALSVLRRELEPPGTVGTLFLVDRHSVRFHPQAFVCDARELERAIQHRRWTEATALRHGELLPGFYDDWICQER